ncbi:MAG: chorismate synthase [Nitrospirae bacterium]|nr:chorismate synthase [Nitrospirota bacterium]
MRIMTSGESHGRALTGIIDGIPSNMPLAADYIDAELRRRQQGYGRGARMKIERDKAEILSGLRWGKTLGSPIAINITNRDWANWEKGMSALPEDEGSISPVTKARPGHADLSGAIKYGFRDLRNVLERSSARETAVRVALGAVCKALLGEFGVVIGSYVTRIGRAGVRLYDEVLNGGELVGNAGGYLLGLHGSAENSLVRCPDKDASQHMIEEIDAAKERGDTLGGIFEVFSLNLPVGLGSHTSWDKRLEGRLSQSVMGIQAVKGVEIGIGFEAGALYGSELMDEIFYDARNGFYRKTNRAGGIEGGMTNGMPLILRAAMKPIPTLRKPLTSVDIVTKEPFEAQYERSDVCAVPACCVIAESVVAIVIADAFRAKFGGDSLNEMKNNYENYIKYTKEF